MKLCARIFSTPKQGNSAEECEDASACNLEQGRAAIADGAGDAFASSLWAQALVQRFIADPPSYEPVAIDTWLDGPITDWHSQIVWEKLPWYTEAKARRGTFATLLGIEFEQEDLRDAQSRQPARWHAVAIGDACLFHLRRGQTPQSFPLQRSTDFNNAPALLSNDKAYTQKSLTELRVQHGELHKDELLVLATDALAQWYVRAIEASHDPFGPIVRIFRDEFLQLVDELRASNSMKNDDVTMMLLWLEEDCSL